jgi:ATPase family protein associated with various cellular activities (AAA)
MTKPRRTLIEQLRAAKRVSTPLVAIETPDPAATIVAVCDGIQTKVPKIAWDVAGGLRGLNEPGCTVVKQLAGEQDPTVGNPSETVRLAARLPEGSMLFLQMANRFLVDAPMFIQGVWNLRDVFKQNHRMLILLGPEIPLPAELTGDVVVFDEPLPDPAALRRIIQEQHDLAELKAVDEVLDAAVEATQGLPAFQVEQVTAMSLSRDGLDVDALWERKRRLIEQTPGLRVYRNAETFQDIGGVELVKEFLSRIMAGRSKPNAVVFVDEIEKMMAGSSGDTSGVSQDQLGTLLSYMQDQAAAGMIFLGPPGSAKSMVAKAAGAAGGVPTVQLDLGASKGSLVGQSEHQLRTALKVISAISNGRSLWIATCNAINELPPELRRRFTLGTFFFDLPTLEERHRIWDIHLRKYGLEGEIVDDGGWTGAEIRQCCDIAWRLQVTLVEASAFVVPVSRSAADRLQALRKLAEGRFLSASRPGVYQQQEDAPKGTGRRRLDLVEVGT